MTAFARLSAIAADPLPTLTQSARAILEARTGRDWGPVNTMPKSDRRAFYALAMELQKAWGRK